MCFWFRVTFLCFVIDEGVSVANALWTALDGVNSQLRVTLMLLSEQYRRDKTSYESIVNYLSSLHSDQVRESTSHCKQVPINYSVAREPEPSRRTTAGVGAIL